MAERGCARAPCVDRLLSHGSGRALFGDDESDEAPLGCIYLDHNATTPCDESVVAAMQPHFTRDGGGNPSSGHEYGRRARAAIDVARRQTAALINCEPAEIVFTGCATGRCASVRVGGGGGGAR